MATPDSSKSLLDWLRLASDDTSDIFFGCFAVIVASTFLALHLNLPDQSTAASPRCFLRRWWNMSPVKQFRRQCIWAIMYVIAPELLVSLAVENNRSASRGVQAFQEYGQGYVSSWSKTHASFANMGGLKFVMGYGGQEIPDSAAYDDLIRPIIQRIFISSRTTTLQNMVAALKSYATRIRLWLRTGIGCFRFAMNICRCLSRSRVDDHQVGTGIELAHIPNNVVESTVDIENELVGETGPASTDFVPGPSQSRAATPVSVDLGAGIFLQGQIDDSRQPLEASTTPALQLGDDQVFLIPRDDEQVSLYLNATQIVIAQVLGILDNGPNLTTEEVEDKGKANVFAKGLAAIQLLWFGVRCIVQLSRNQPMAQLELATFTYVICALFSYGLQWHKPQNVELPIEYRVCVSSEVRPATEQDIEILAIFSGPTFLRRNFIPPFGMDDKLHDPRQRIPTDISLSIFAIFGSADGGGAAMFDDDFAGVVACMLFGALYCLGWNHEFPSRWELWAWRVASIVITASLIPYSIANAVCTIRYSHLFRTGLGGTVHIVHAISLYGLLGLYVACRLFMLVEMIRTLFV